MSDAGPRPRRWTRGMTRALVRMRGRGLSFGDIARRLGVTRAAAVGKAVFAGLARRSRVRAMNEVALLPDEPEALGPVRVILDAGLCHWIRGDARGDWRMCGHEAVRGAAWCAHHFARVYQVPHSASAKASADQDVNKTRRSFSEGGPPASRQAPSPSRGEGQDVVEGAAR